MIAQITRAALLAMATVATRAGLRASSWASRGSVAPGPHLAWRSSEVMPTIKSLRR